MNFRASLMLLFITVTTGFCIDLTDSTVNFDSFMRTRGDLSGEVVVFYWTGSIYSFVPGQRSSYLFEADGYNISRLQEQENGQMLLSREVFVYRDPETGEILDEWLNPFTGDTVMVVPVWNDPVNSFMPRSDGDWQFEMPYTLLADGRVSWNLDILLAYPSPLPADSFPEFSASNLYQGAELFHFFVSMEDLENESLTSVPTQISWTRFGQWLPWMRMGDRPGYLIYHCAGYKLPGGFDSLPDDLKQLVLETNPEFADAPSERETPNETSWTYFRHLLDSGEMQ
jgi:hypothetical protein